MKVKLAPNEVPVDETVEKASAAPRHGSITCRVGHKNGAALTLGHISGKNGLREREVCLVQTQRSAQRAWH